MLLTEGDVIVEYVSVVLEGLAVRPMTWRWAPPHQELPPYPDFDFLDAPPLQ